MPQGGKTLDVLVDGPGPDVAAAGDGDFRLAKAADERAHEVVAGAHLAHQFHRGLPFGDGAGVDAHGMGGLVHFDPGPQALKHTGQHPDILNERQIFNGADIVRQQYRR